MTPRYYVDTSAYLAVLLGEAGGEALERTLRRGELLSSTLMVLEAQRTLVHAARTGRLAAADLHPALDRLEADVELFTLRDLTVDLGLDRAMPLVATPRSLDLVHLRTARWFHQQAPLTRVLSLDVGLVAAAREVGLPA